MSLVFLIVLHLSALVLETKESKVENVKESRCSFQKHKFFLMNHKKYIIVLLFIHVYYEEKSCITMYSIGLEEALYYEDW